MTYCPGCGFTQPYPPPDVCAYCAYDRRMTSRQRRFNRRLEERRAQRPRKDKPHD